jgi:hypothetical protein
VHKRSKFAVYSLFVAQWFPGLVAKVRLSADSNRIAETRAATGPEVPYDTIASLKILTPEKIGNPMISVTKQVLAVQFFPFFLLRKKMADFLIT